MSKTGTVELGGGGGTRFPQYFQNYKELVRKSVLCPPPPNIAISKLLGGPCESVGV